MAEAKAAGQVKDSGARAAGAHKVSPLHSEALLAHPPWKPQQVKHFEKILSGTSQKTSLIITLNIYIYNFME